MKQNTWAKWVLTAAIAAVLPATTAKAQYQVGGDGGALDANNQVGGGGRNIMPGQQIQQLPTGNQIITGNVTGGRHFRDTINYTDPREFRGVVGGQASDQFIRQSQGAPLPQQPASEPWRPQPFYGRALTGQTPQGFVATPQGTFVPEPMPTDTVRDIRIDTRVGGPLNGDVSLARPGEMLLEGGIDPLTRQPTFLSASPLAGLRQWTPGELDQPMFREGTERFRMDGRRVQQMRDELAGRTPRRGATEEEPAPGELRGQMPRPFDAPQAGALEPGRLEGALEARTLAESGARPGLEWRLAVPPRQQSTQYAELQKRLETYYGDRLQRTDEERHREFQRQLRARDEAEQRMREAQEPDPEARPDLDFAQIGRELLEQSRRQQEGLRDQAAGRPQPVQIGSLADGVQGEGLANILREAENEMRAGQFMAAIEHYQAAEQVAPNNPLIWMGRAHAELAAGYYVRSAQTIRRAFSNDPTLMMGQYDLRQMIGNQRLERLVTDLKELARRQENDPNPVFLLAYLAYNTGSVEQAGMYLDLAAQRAGAANQFYRMVGQHWNIPQDAQDGAGEVPLDRVLAELEGGNVTSLRVESGQISGQFRQPVRVEDGQEPVRRFTAPLPPGAERGPMSRWIRDKAAEHGVRVAE